MAPDRRPERLAALGRGLADAGLDGLLVSHPANLRYLTGFTGTAGLLLVQAGVPVLICDGRYAGQAAGEAGDVVSVREAPTSLWEGLRQALAGVRVRALGFEADRLTVAQVERLRGVTDLPLRPVTGLVEALRVRKDPSEVAAIRAAAVLALEALEEVLPGVRPGLTEVEVATRLEAALRRRGSAWHPFPTIVASGPRTALPHARATARELAAGDLLLLDWGAELDGYCADLTRTVVLGRADDRQREVYGAVRSAQQAALAGLRPGLTGREADAVAREVLRARGLGEAFRHSLGHGLGLEVHEDPRLAPTAEGHLPAGAVVTVEPGAYLEGWGGVRLEDDVHLAPDGPELLSPGAPDLVELDRAWPDRLHPSRPYEP